MTGDQSSTNETLSAALATAEARAERAEKEAANLAAKLAVLSGYTVDDWRQPDFWQTVIHPEDREMALACSRRCSRACRPRARASSSST